MIPAILSLALVAAPKDATVTDLKDGFVRVETKAYILEMPKDWSVTRETPWGARDMTPKEGEGKMGVMTAPPTQASWDELYRTSLYFITRERKGKPTAYRLGKAPQGYETMSFEVLDKDGWADRRYVILKKDDRILALNVNLASKKVEKAWMAHFQRMIDTAKIKD
jgi:hypothetical protein